MRGGLALDELLAWASELKVLRESGSAMTMSPTAI
jgi:hypothetical protein